MKLSKEHIKQLYVFVQKKGIQFIDLQDELVERMANAIENHIKENPEASFDEALKVEYKKLGIFGFDDDLVKRRSLLGKKIIRLYVNQMLSFLRLPNLLFTLGLLLVSYYLSNHVSGLVVLCSGCVIYVFFSVYFFYRFRYLRKEGKKYLFVQQLISFLCHLWFSFFYLFFYPPFFLGSDLFLVHPFYICGLVFLTVLHIVVTYKILRNWKLM